jgi:predicted nucleotidyltransferase
MVSVTDPVLARFRAAVARLYGDRLERVVLFGSRARGEARPDSDYDVVVFLKDFGLSDRHKEIGRLSHITAAIIQDTGALITALPYPAGAYAARTPLMHEIRREGLDL